MKVRGRGREWPFVTIRLEEGLSRNKEKGRMEAESDARESRLS